MGVQQTFNGTASLKMHNTNSTRFNNIFKKVILSYHISDKRIPYQLSDPKKPTPSILRNMKSDIFVVPVFVPRTILNRDSCNNDINHSNEDALT